MNGLNNKQTVQWMDLTINKLYNEWTKRLTNCTMNGLNNEQTVQWMDLTVNKLYKEWTKQ